jgi:activator of Hsp90 ATPase-like protein
MKNKNFTTAILVDQSPQEAFKAINDVRGWWSGEIEGNTDKVGSEFTYRYKDVHLSVQKIKELVPGKRVVWQVLESRLGFPKENEWTGTDIVFDISQKQGKTEVRFTHIGLVPAFQCYGDCSGAWGALINENLRKLIATGEPQPDAFA